MTDIDREWLLATVLAATVAFCLGMFVGGCTAESHRQREAVEAGAAEFYADELGDVHFRWLGEEAEG